MASDPNQRTAFSFAVHELDQAGLAPQPSRDAVAAAAAAGVPLEAANEPRGSDPYNTTGSFDHKRKWMRMGKR